MTKVVNGLIGYGVPGLLHYRDELLTANNGITDLNRDFELERTEYSLSEALGMLSHITNIGTIASDYHRDGVVANRADIFRPLASYYDRVDNKEDLDVEPIPIVGVTGPIAGGKGTVGDILQRTYGYPNFTLSERLREFAVGQGSFPPQTREDLRAVNDLLKGAFGKPVFVRWTLDTIKKMQKRNLALESRFPGVSNRLKGASIDGFRSLEEAQFFLQQPSTLLLAVTSTPENRFQRLEARARPGDDFNREKFLESDAIEQNWINPILDVAVVINNDGSEEELESAVLEVTEAWRQEKGIS